MAAVKTLRVQPTPSTHHSAHTHDILSPSSFPLSSASSPSSYSHHSTGSSPSRIQHTSFHAARQHALRLQLVQRRLERLKAPGNKRVSLWDTLHNRKISGFASPLQKNLGKYLELHPHCIVYETYLADKGLTDGKKKKTRGEEKKEEESSGSSSEEDKSDDGSSSDSSDSSSSSDASSHSSSSGRSGGSGSNSSMSPHSDGGTEEPNSAPPTTAAVERQTSESAEADAEDEEVDSGSSGRASEQDDSDNSSLSENDSMKTEDDTDSLPTSTINYYAPAAPPASVTALLPPPNPVVLEPPSAQLPAPTAVKHRPPPFSLSSLPFIPRLYTPQPDPLPFEPFIAGPVSPVAASALSASRAEPMSPPSPLSSVRFSTSEEEDEGRKVRPLLAGTVDMEDDPLSLLDTARGLSSNGLASLAPSLYFSPTASPLHSQSSSLTPMVAALHTSASPSPSAVHSAAPPSLALPPVPVSVAAFALPSLLSPSHAQWGMSPFLFERVESNDVTMEV